MQQKAIESVAIINLQNQMHAYNPVKNFGRPSIFLWLIAAIIFFLTSCTPTKNILYFENLPKDTTLHNLVTKDFELKIKKGDLINIGVSSLSAENSILFTAPQTSINATGASGYLVDKNGNILYPKLGTIYVEGMTRGELKNLLLKDLLPYLKDPIVTVNFVNHKVTIFGEVGGPQILNMTGESLTLLEAIALSGQLSKTARKDNILVIRESNNGADKQFKRLNLNNSSIFYSPFYYLRPNDIVYVEPDPAKEEGVNKTQRIISYATAGLSLVLIILDRVFR